MLGHNDTESITVSNMIASGQSVVQLIDGIKESSWDKNWEKWFDDLDDQKIREHITVKTGKQTFKFKHLDCRKIEVAE